jgi:hypothetical protein
MSALMDLLSSGVDANNSVRTRTTGGHELLASIGVGEVTGERGGAEANEIQQVGDQRLPIGLPVAARKRLEMFS